MKNVDQELVFKGELLGSTSSWTEAKGRWHEVYIYKTESGQYVVSKIGRSDVFHDRSCRRVKMGGEDLVPTVIDKTLMDILVPCERCRPHLAEGNNVLLEPDKCWAQVAPTPTGAIATLYHRDGDDVKYIPTMSRLLLNDVMQKDVPLREAYVAHFAVQSVS